MRKWELIKQSKPLKIKSKILSNLLNEKYGLKLGEFNNTAGTERVKLVGRVIFVSFNPKLAKVDRAFVCFSHHVDEQSCIISCYLQL